MTVQAVLDEIRERPGTGEVIPIIDPATEEQITEFTDAAPKPSTTPSRGRRRPPSPGCGSSAAHERAKVLWRVADLIDENKAILAELESLNAGMPPGQAEMIVKVGSEWFRYYAGWCTKIEGIAVDVNTGGLIGIDSQPARLHPQRALRRGRD